MPEHALGGWRAANVSRADEQNLHEPSGFLRDAPAISMCAIMPETELSPNIAAARAPLFVPPGDGRIVILTGAGISKESGLDTFRDKDGIWASVRWQDVATPEAFARDPERVHAFYNMRRARNRSLDIQPNAAHFALAKLEAEWPGEVLIVTQNVDTLHERAGTRNLIHMHGVHAQARCNGCGHVVDWSGDMSVRDLCAGCNRAGGLRPNVVWFGEMPMEMERIGAALQDCDLFVSIG